MIPKVIHYIWLGGKPEPTSVLMMINSWRRHLLDYKIVKWDESNIPIEKLRKENKFFDKCCKYNLYAFMSDYLRLWILYNYGGIYMDTDVEVVKSFDPLLNNKGFIGYEKGNSEYGELIGTGTIGAEKKNRTIKFFLDYYKSSIWNEEEYINTVILKKMYISNSDKFDDIEIMSVETFAPYSPYNEKTEELVENPNTYAIHWYKKDWGLTPRGYMFISTKYIKNPVLRNILKIRRYIGYHLKGK